MHNASEQHNHNGNRTSMPTPFSSFFALPCGLLMRWLRSPFPVCWFIAQLSLPHCLLALPLLRFFTLAACNFCLSLSLPPYGLCIFWSMRSNAYRWVVQPTVCLQARISLAIRNTIYCLLAECMHTFTYAIAPHRNMNGWKKNNKQKNR